MGDTTPPLRFDSRARILRSAGAGAFFFFSSGPRRVRTFASVDEEDLLLDLEEPRGNPEPERSAAADRVIGLEEVAEDAAEEEVDVGAEVAAPLRLSPTPLATCCSALASWLSAARGSPKASRCTASSPG